MNILLLLSLFLLSSCSGCHHDATPFDLFSGVDRQPPVLLSTSSPSPFLANLRFDESVKETEITAEGNRVVSTAVTGSVVTVSFGERIALGESVTIQGRVKDLKGNSNRFSTKIWAHNPNLPSLMINEFTTKGTESQPDRVELYVTKSGNLSGITLANGPFGAYDDHCIFPDRLVWEGEYIVVAFQNGTKESDYQSEKMQGLSSNNGCIVLLSSPFRDAEIMDAVAYSNNASSTSGGWGSDETKERIGILVETGAWMDDNPSHAALSAKATSTRSLNRDRKTESKSGEAWYTCIQGGASFGGKNSEERYGY